MMKFLSTMSAFIFCIVGLAAEENNSERIKQEIKVNGFATFSDIASSPLDNDDVEALLKLFAGISKPRERGFDDDVHATAYSSVLFYRILEGQLYKTPSYDHTMTYEQDALIHDLTVRILDLFQVPENAINLKVRIFFYSDCEKVLREGLSLIKSREESMFKVEVPKLLFHQDRPKGETFPHRKYYLYFQVLETKGFCPHYSRVGRLRSDHIKPLLDSDVQRSFLSYIPNHYNDNSVENIIEILCKKGAGYAIYESESENEKIVHGHSGFSTYISGVYNQDLNKQFGFEVGNKKNALDSSIFIPNKEFELPTRKVVGWQIEFEIGPPK